MGESFGFLPLAIRLKYADQHSSRSASVIILHGEMVGDRDEGCLVHGAQFRLTGGCGATCSATSSLAPSVGFAQTHFLA